MKLLALAWRNTWRNRRRTVATTGAMAVALLATVTYSGLVEGYTQAMERDALDFDLAAVQVVAPGFADHPSLETALSDDQRTLGALREAGIPASPRFVAGGLASARDSSAAVQVQGLDVEQDARVVRLHEQVLQGRWLDPSDPRGVVVGRRLAHALDVKPGDDVSILSRTADGRMANARFTVRGVLRSVGEATDRAGVFMTVAQFRDLLSYEGAARRLLVRRPEAMLLDVVERAVRAAAPGMDVQTWRRLNPTLASVLDATHGLLGMLTFIIHAVVAIVVLNAMLMAVFERIRELGVLKALGIHPYDVVKLVFLEALLQVAVAVAAGLALSVPVLAWLAIHGIDTGALAGVSVMGAAMGTRWYAVVQPRTFAGPVAMLVVMSMLAVVYPARKAARLRPVEAMRHP